MLLTRGVFGCRDWRGRLLEASLAPRPLSLVSCTQDVSVTAREDGDLDGARHCSSRQRVSRHLALHSGQCFYTLQF